MSISDRDFEALSALLDGELTGKAFTRMKTRLESDQDLQDAYEQLRRTKMMMRSLPKLRAPRNYMLTPQMAGITQKPPRAFPILRLASVLATLILLVVFMGDLFILPNLVMQPSETLQFAVPAVEEPILEAEIMESQLPEAPAEEEMDRAMPEFEAAPPAAAEAIIAPEEELAADAEVQLQATLTAPAEDLVEGLGSLAETAEEPLLKIEEREPGLTPQFATEDQPGLDIQRIIRLTEIALVIIALATGMSAFYLYRKFK